MTPHIFSYRNHLKDGTRRFFNNRSYLEVETPILVDAPGMEVHLQFFRSEWKDYQGRGHSKWLRSSPELHMKQLLSYGHPKIYQLAPSFRNSGENSLWHHPEFTMLEWYRNGEDYLSFIEETEELVRFLLTDFTKKFPDKKGKLLLPKQKFSRLSVYEAFERYVGIELIDNDDKLAQKAIIKKIISVTPHDDFETAFFKILLDKIEPELLKEKAVFLHEYPPSQAALAKIENGRAQRFELYLYGIELCNGFFELTSFAENKARYEEINAKRVALGYEKIAEEKGFFQALEQGLETCCGNALGFDRLLALFLGEKEITSIVPFKSFF